MQRADETTPPAPAAAAHRLRDTSGYLRCDAMFRAKARVEERLRDAASDPVASADLVKVTDDLKAEGCF